MRRPATLSIIVALLLLAAAAYAAFDRGPFQYRKEIKIPEDQPESYTLLELDGEVFDTADARLRDLRITDPNGEQVPYKLLIEGPKWISQSYSVTPLDMGVTADKKVRFELQLPQNLLQHNNLKIETAEHNFHCRVDLDAWIDDGWTRLKHGMGIFDYFDAAENVESQHLLLTYPDSTAKKLRCTIRCKEGIIVRPESLNIEYRVRREAKLIGHKAVLQSSVRDEDARTTTLTYDLSHRYPISHIKFTVEGSNFSRPVHVFTLSAEPDKWRPVASGKIYNLNTELYNVEKLDISFGEIWTRKLKIVIDDGDNPPLDIQKIAAYSKGRYLYFPGKPGGSYYLLYAGKDVQSPVYDFQEVYRFLPESRAKALLPGQQQDNPHYVKPLIPGPPKDLKPILTAVLLVAVLVLGALIFRLARPRSAERDDPSDTDST